VALARALINRPSVLLLDEPLGALDLKLRQQMQVELRSLQRQLGITFIFVTHDQGEALSMSDRLAVFNEGRIEQVGTPREVYERPATRFAAEFVGDSNTIEMRGEAALGDVEGIFSLRPEKLRVSTAQPSVVAGVLAVAGRVSDVQFHGASVRYVVALEDGSSMTAVTGNRGFDASGSRAVGVGAEVWLAWSPADMHPLAEPDVA
jgi:putative spermidine/putrescine transport system ATP-binding protein